MNPDDNAMRRALPWSIASNGLSAVAIAWTFSGTVFLLFMDRLGLAKAQIGTVLSLIPFCGLVSLGLAHPISRWGRKRAFVLFWCVRYLLLLFLCALPRHPPHAFALPAVVYLLFGVALVGASLSIGRILCTNVVPAAA